MEEGSTAKAVLRVLRPLFTVDTFEVLRTRGSDRVAVRSRGGAASTTRSRPMK